MRPLDPRLLRHVQSARTHLIRSAVLGALTAAGTVLVAVALARLISALADTGHPSTVTGESLLWLIAAFSFRAGAAWAQERCSQRSASRVIGDLRGLLVSRVAAAGDHSVAGRAAELTALATTGMDGLSDYLVRYLPQLAQAVVVPFGVLSVIAVYDPVSAVLLVLVLPLVPLFMVLIGMATQREALRRMRSLHRLGAQLLDLIAGMPTLRTLGRDQRQASRIRATATGYRRATMTTLRSAFLSSFALELLASLSVAAVAVGIGLRLVVGELSLGTGLLVLLLAPEIFGPLRQLGAAHHASADGLAALAAAMPWLERQPPPRIVTTAAVGDGQLAVLEDVTVRYEGRAAPVLNGLTLHVCAGRLVLVRGPSGSGKSTAMAVLMGLLAPTEGRLCIGDRRGEIAAYQSEIAWLPQRPVVVPGTLADNLRLYEPEADRRMLEAAVGATGLTDVVAARGWDAPLSSGGNSLSAGERQRLALARVWLRVRSGCQLIVLDEPTSHLDLLCRQRVYQLMRDWRDGGVAVVVVSHDRAIADYADEVVTLPGGTAAPRPVQHHVHLAVSG